MCIDVRSGRRSRKQSLSYTGFADYVRFPGETEVNKDTKVTYTLGRKKWLIIEVNIALVLSLTSPKLLIESGTQASSIN